MATRVKTIEFATTTIITTLAAVTNRDLVSPTSIYIPETGITFKSVVLFVDCTNDINTTTAASLTVPIISITLGLAAISNVTLVNPIANSGEKEDWQFSRDVTSYFTTNWTGTNMTWSVRVNFTGMATANHAAKIIITYEYEDTSSPTAHIKTIRIPIESTRTLLTTSYQTVGGATAIPGIKNFSASPYLPETGITIRQIFLEMWGNSANATTTDFTWQTRIAGVSGDTYRHEAALNSATWAHAITDITTQVLTGATILECLSLTTTSRFCTVGGMIVVTYEFNPTTSTRIFNSLMLGAVDTSGWMGGITEADGGVWERNIYIEEPNTITMKESGLCLFQNDSGTYTFNVKVSGSTVAQSGYTSYVNTQGSLQCGTFSMVHRIDTGGQYGAAGGGGISLARGKNLYRVIFYSGTAQAGWNLSGFLILNYISDKHANGVGVHTHSVYQHVTDNITAAGSRVNTSAAAVAPSIPETYYSLIGFLFWVNYNIGASTDNNFTVDAEVISTDPMQGGNGWISLYQGTTRSDNENMNGWIYAAARTNFTRWNGDPDPDRLNIKTDRKYRLSSGALETGAMGYWYTYNAITYTVSGTCTGFSSDGSGIPVEIYRINSSTSDELILNTTTIAGGTFSTTWIDNTDTLYAAARQDDTHVGRSKNRTAG